MRVAIVGVTGVVGQKLVELLEHSELPVSELVGYASPASDGQPFLFRGLSQKVRALQEPLSSQRFDLVILSAGRAVSEAWVPRLETVSDLVIDNSSFWRMESDVPLVVAPVNPEDALGHSGLIANPNCTSAIIACALAPIQRAGGIERVSIATYQAVSGGGRRALAELDDPQSAEQEAPGFYPHPIQGNVFPQCEKFPAGSSSTSEENKLQDELRKILHDPTLPIRATAVRVPVRIGHSADLNLTLSRSINAEEAREILQSAPGLALVDAPQGAVYPTPLLAAGRDEVLVGRVRVDPTQEKGLDLFVSGDNLLRGAALNALETGAIALEARRNTLGRPSS